MAGTGRHEEMIKAGCLLQRCQRDYYKPHCQIATAICIDGEAVGGLHCRYVIVFVVLRETAAQQIVTKRSYYGYFEFGFYNT